MSNFPVEQKAPIAAKRELVLWFSWENGVKRSWMMRKIQIRRLAIPGTVSFIVVQYQNHVTFDIISSVPPLFGSRFARRHGGL